MTKALAEGQDFVTERSLLSMYLLLLAVIVFRPRGLAGKASVLER